MTAAPTVSVIIPAFNAASTIERAIRSVRSQDWPALEIVVVDDASTDGTPEIVGRLAGDDIRLIQLPVNKGAAHARNVGIEVSTGSYVAFLDADDEWLPTKLRRQVECLERNPGAGLVACGTDAIGADGTNYGEIGKYKGPVVTGPDAWRALLTYSFLATPAVMVRRDVLKRVGTFDETLRVGEDQDLWIRIALASDVAYVREPLVHAHERAGSLTKRDLFAGVQYLLPMIRRHVAANRQRLTPREVHRILGTRMAVEGRHLYYSGHWGPGAALILRAVLLGQRPIANLAFLARSGPHARWLKRLAAVRRPHRASHPPDAS